MTDSVAVIVPTFGSEEVWFPRAENALYSVYEQTWQPDEIFHIHEKTLADARNRGAEEATTGWVIFLDADDELDPFYIEAMMEGEGQIRRPSTLGVANGVEDDYAVMIDAGDLRTSNYIIIGAMVQRGLVLKAGGFADLPILEDWDLWLRLVTEFGASVGDVPEAIYKVNVIENSRNHQGDVMHGQAYADIRRRYAHRSLPSNT